ncbi:hypothetical protein RMATCC62417_18381 [Rhizopus microsporus]|nr:hypothetical protein RMATCC62417_18381 [Rhizopus microsporus]
MSTTNTWESSLTPTEVTTYKQLFKAAALTQPNMVTGLEAVQFFARSELPNTVLSEIWETADEHNLGYLTPDTFAVALKLIACAQNHIKPKSPLLSTPTPLPRIKGIQLTPESDHALITPAERMKYQSIYKAQRPTDFGIQAEAAKNLFLKSKLPNDQLAQIWNLADIRRCGYLNESEFIIAMHYIAKLMDKSMTELPAVLPQSVYLSALGQQSVFSPSSQRASSMTSTISNVDQLVPSQDKARYESYFNKLDRQGRGIIQQPDAFEFFKRSKLSDTELVHIWNMVDKDGKQTLNSTQFAAAMHLIHSKLSGQSIMSPTISPSVMTASPQMISQAMPVKEEEEEDLLGEDNQELAEETNKVNLLQNQIETTKKATRDLQAQKSRIEQSLSALKEKNTDLRHQQEELQSKNESESMQLQQLKETLSYESPTWERVKAEFESAEKDLESLKKQKDEVQNELKQGQNENERLRRSVHNIQMETLRFTKQLDELQEKHKRKQERAAAKKAALEKAEAERIAAEQKKKREEEERQRIEKQEEAERQRVERERQEEEERQRVEKQKEEERQRIEKQKEEERLRAEKEKQEEEERQKIEKERQEEEERQRDEKKRQSQPGPEEDGGHMEKERQITDERRPSQEQGLSRSDREKEPEIVGQTEEIARPVSESIKEDIPHEQLSTKSELTQDQTGLENSLPQGPKGEELTESSISNLEQIVPDKDNKEQEIQQAQLAQYTDESEAKEDEEIKDVTKGDATDKITPIEAEAAIIAPERNEQNDKEEQVTHDRDVLIIKPHNEDNETGKTLDMNPFKESGISQDSNVSIGHTRQPDYLADTEGEATDSADDFYDAVENGDSNLIKNHPYNNGPSVRSKELTKRPEALEPTKSSELLGRIERKEGEKRSKNKEEEEEPVMISSLSESDSSDTNARESIS